MKTFILTLLLSLAAFLFGNAQNAVEVVITNFENENGKALVGLYDSEEEFLKTPWLSKKAEIKNGEVTVLFEDIPDGTYAISAFHDEDEDGEIDMLLGFYPLESYATSNNAPAKFGPPQWQDAKFDCAKGEKEVQKIIMM